MMHYSLSRCLQYKSGLSCAFHFLVYSPLYALMIVGLDSPQQETLKYCYIREERLPLQQLLA
jgi:hypothetical protein